MSGMLWPEDLLDEFISKGREVEAVINKIAEKALLEKLTLNEECKKKARESEKMAEVKRKYAASWKALYDQRAEHIESIPDFWQKAILNCSDLLKYFSKYDKEIIKFLKSVVVEEKDGQNDKPQCVITFFFEKNPYFENTRLKTIYSRTDEGIFHKQGTKILWKEGTVRDTTATDIHKSFFTRFFDPKRKKMLQKRHDKVLKMIEECLWPKALYLSLSGITATEVEKGTEQEIALNELRIIQHKLATVNVEESGERITVEREFEKNARELRVAIEQKCNEDQRPFYQKRNEVVKGFPSFWLLAFLSHYALGNLFSLEDEKIFKFVDSMDVKDDQDVVSGYTITLNFLNGNPYFTNPSLTKRISFCEDGTTNLSAVDIKWKVDMDIATEYTHDTDVTNASFFTWFCAPQVVEKGSLDEVSEVIKDDLWPNAVEYFTNGNKSDEKVKQRRRLRAMKHCLEIR